LLFLDEPFEGVDAITARVIRELLSSYVARGSTVFLSSHVLAIVEQMCTHVGIIARGSLVDQASLETLRKGASLEDRFIEKVGSARHVVRQLSWVNGGGSSRGAGPR
jgi:ABC-2 type transport system ATP-binding protein